MILGAQPINKIPDALGLIGRHDEHPVVPGDDGQPIDADEGNVSVFANDHVVGGIDSQRLPESDVAVGVGVVDASERVPRTEIVPREVGRHNCHVRCLLHDRVVDAQWLNLLESAGRIAGRKRGDERRQRRLACFRKKGFRQPGKDTGVPEMAGLDVGRCGVGVRFLVEGDHLLIGVLHRARLDVAVSRLWPRRRNANSDERPGLDGRACCAPSNSLEAALDTVIARERQHNRLFIAFLCDVGAVKQRWSGVPLGRFGDDLNGRKVSLPTGSVDVVPLLVVVPCLFGVFARLLDVFLAGDDQDAISKPGALDRVCEQRPRAIEGEKLLRAMATTGGVESGADAAGEDDGNERAIHARIDAAAGQKDTAGWRRRRLLWSAPLKTALTSRCAATSGTLSSDLLEGGRMPTIEEKRVYADRTGQAEVYVASSTGIVVVNVSDDLVGEFSLASRCEPRDVAAAEGEVAAATAEDVLSLAGGAFEATGFGPAVAVDIADGVMVAADEDGHLARREAPGDVGDGEASGHKTEAGSGADWTPVGTVDGSVAGIDWPFVATDSGVARIDDGVLREAGLSGVNDVAAAGIPLAATSSGLYKLGNGWMTVLDGSFQAVESKGTRAHAASKARLYGEEGDWQQLDVPVSEPIADIAYTSAATVCVTQTGTLAITAGDRWRTHILGVSGVGGVTVR